MVVFGIVFFWVCFGVDYFFIVGLGGEVFVDYLYYFS